MRAYGCPMRLMMVLLILVGWQPAAVVMVHPVSGREVQCGPYSAVGLRSHASAVQEGQCIQDYKEQGYVRK